jgi:hypothetical protein
LVLSTGENPGKKDPSSRNEELSCIDCALQIPFFKNLEFFEKYMVRGLGHEMHKVIMRHLVNLKARKLSKALRAMLN